MNFENETFKDSRAALIKNALKKNIVQHPVQTAKAFEKRHKSKGTQRYCEKNKETEK